MSDLLPQSPGFMGTIRLAWTADSDCGMTRKGISALHLKPVICHEEKPSNKKDTDGEHQACSQGKPSMRYTAL